MATVGASFTLEMLRVNDCEASTEFAAPMLASSALTVTLKLCFVSKSGLAPTKYSCLPVTPPSRISKLEASAPDNESVSVPSASSVTAISATLTPPAVLVCSGIDVTVLLSTTAEGASLTSVTVVVTLRALVWPLASVARTVNV